jgi:D-proline reductase (dithiol) PrdB
MGYMDEFSLDLRLYLKAYRWRRIDPVPWAPLDKPLSECRLALISSASLVLPDHEPFDDSVRGGDPSFRDIPRDIDVGTLIDTHPSTHFDHSGMHQDVNVAFPIDRVRELAKAGRIGEVNERHLSFRGAIDAPKHLINRTAPEVAGWLAQDGVDIALLVPV